MGWGVNTCKGCIYEPKSERGRCTVKALYGPDYCFMRDGRAERKVGLQDHEKSAGEEKRNGGCGA